jgi:hypothetical protein
MLLLLMLLLLLLLLLFVPCQLLYFYSERLWTRDLSIGVSVCEEEHGDVAGAGGDVHKSLKHVSVTMMVVVMMMVMVVVMMMVMMIMMTMMIMPTTLPNVAS